MEQEKRKSPEELLEAIKRQEQGAGRGHLKSLTWMQRSPESLN